jgi:hypothetical protein
MVLEDEKSYVVSYQWRPGGKSWFTVLHQAAWHGAPLGVADNLIKRGALRSLQVAKGRKAFVVTMERGHLDLLKRLEPPKPLDPFRPDQLDQHLAELIIERSGPPFVDISNFTAPPNWSNLLRYPPVHILPKLRQGGCGVRSESTQAFALRSIRGSSR